MDEALTKKADLPISEPVIASRETRSHPVNSGRGVSVFQGTEKSRAALYIDGFNLYHAIDDLGQPHLKWLNFAALGERIIDRNKERLAKVRWFTAIQPRAPADKNNRHRDYITALKFYNVTVHEGHFIFDDIDCRRCSHTWTKPQEKETDVGIGVRILDDAYQDVFDTAYLVTADSDQGATAKILKIRFSQKKLVSVVPPGMEASRAILTHTPHKLKLPVEYIEDCLLPAYAMKDATTIAFRRPAAYDPPSGWLPPRERRKKAAEAKT